MRSRLMYLFALAALPNLLGGAARAAETPVAGAWIDQNLDCSSVFVATGKGQKFKQPADLFAPAFIISGKRLTTPQASCSLKSVSTLADRTQLQLSCANSVSVSPVTVQLSRGSDGTLVRYMDSNDKSGSKYKLCK